MKGTFGQVYQRWAMGLAAVCLLLGAVPTVVGGESEGATNKVAIEKWVYSRERKTIKSSNRVIVNFAVKNVTDKALKGVSVQVTLFSGLGQKVAGPLRQNLGSIKPKGKAAARVSANMVPAFGAYEVVVSYPGGKETWYSNSDRGDPKPKATGLAENTARVVVVGHEVAANRAGQLAGQVRVRNEGSLEAKDVKVQVTYWAAGRGGKRVKIGEWTGKLGNGKVPAGKEIVVPLRVPRRVPRSMKTFEIRAICAEAGMEAQMSGGEFANISDLEAAHWQFKRSGNKQQDLDVSCDVRNGLKGAARDIRLNISFYKTDKGKRKKVKSFAHTMKGPLKAGEVAPATFTVKGMPSYDGYECAFEYGTGSQEQAAAKKPVAPTFRKMKAVEVIYKEVTTRDDGTVMALCAARNGLAHQVKDVAVTFRLLKQDGSLLKEAKKILSDPLLPGEDASFVIRVPGGKGFASYDSRVTFVQGKTVPGAGAP